MTMWRTDTFRIKQRSILQPVGEKKKKAPTGTNLKIDSAHFFSLCKCDSVCVPAFIKLQQPSPAELLVWHRGTPAVLPSPFCYWDQLDSKKMGEQVQQQANRQRLQLVCVWLPSEGCVQDFDMYIYGTWVYFFHAVYYDFGHIGHMPGVS